MTDKIRLNTPEGLVTFYTLDKPFQTKEIIQDEKGRITNGKIGIQMEFDPEAEGVAELVKTLSHVKKGVKEVLSKVTGKKAIRLTASTSFIPKMSNGEGAELLEIPHMFQGDVMKVKLTVETYDYNHKESGAKGTSLNLSSVNILLHDTSNRVELTPRDDDVTAIALKEANKKLEAMKA